MLPGSALSAPPPRWRMDRILGKGSYGIVYLAIYERPESDGVRRQIAVKTAPLEMASSLAKENKIYEIFRDCPGIVRCYYDQITIERGLRQYNLLLEYAPGGTLGDLIGRTGGLGLPEVYVRLYAWMILRGLLCMHEKGYVHCDLKPANILAFPLGSDRRCNTRSTLLYRLKLADFGLAKEPEEKLPREEWMGTFRGTPYYMSPESVELGLIGPALDIWSLGCIVAQMLTGLDSPWPRFFNYLSTEDFARHLVGSRMTPTVPACVSESGKEFLTKCVERDPTKRWSAQELLLHPYVNELFSNKPQISTGIACSSSSAQDFG